MESDESAEELEVEVDLESYGQQTPLELHSRSQHKHGTHVHLRHRHVAHQKHEHIEGESSEEIDPEEDDIDSEFLDTDDEEVLKHSNIKVIVTFIWNSVGNYFKIYISTNISTD